MQRLRNWLLINQLVTASLQVSSDGRDMDRGQKYLGSHVFFIAQPHFYIKHQRQCSRYNALHLCHVSCQNKNVCHSHQKHSPALSHSVLWGSSNDPLVTVHQV